MNSVVDDPGPAWPVTFIKVIYVGSYDVIRGHQQVFANNSRLKRAADMAVVSLCSACQDASPDMQHELLGSTCALKLP